MDVITFLEELRQLATLLHDDDLGEARQYFNTYLQPRYDRWLADATGPLSRLVPIWIEINEVLNVEHARRAGVASLQNVRSYFASEFEDDADAIKKSLLN